MSDLDIIKQLADELIDCNIDFSLYDEFSNEITCGCVIKDERVTHFICKNSNLENIPDKIFDLSGLTYLDLSGNKLTSIPENFQKFSASQFSKIDFSNNAIERLPELTEQIFVTTLNLSRNKIAFIPNSFLSNLNKADGGKLTVNLSHNKLRFLPNSVKKYSYGIINEIDLDTRWHEESLRILLLNNPIKYPPKEIIDKEQNAVATFTRYYDFIESLISAPQFSDTTIPFFLKQIRIFNYQAIKDLKIDTLPDNSQWIFLTGENGFGKTSVLRGIVACLNGPNDGDSIIFKQDELSTKDKKEASYIEIKDDLHNHINKIDNEFHTKFENFAAYGPNRTQFFRDEGVLNRTGNLFRNSSLILDFEKKYKDWNIFSVENKKKIENFEFLLKQLLPNINRIAIDKETSRVIYYEKSDSGVEFDDPVFFDQLAMGMRSVMGFVFDFVFRLGGESFDFEIENGQIRIEGIVIIDEFDNHLHPKWQRMLVEKLSKLFPRVQFIVSTHSAIPLLGAPKNSVFIKVDRTKEDGITAEILDVDISELPPENILSSPLFDFQDVIPEAFRGKRLRTQKGYDEVKFQQTLEDKLQQIANESGVEFNNNEGEK